MIVLITGASSGIGAATAHAFARGGARLVLAARRLDRLHVVAGELGAPAHLLQLDVRDRAAVHAALSRLPPPFDAIDVLVNNAGLSRGFEPLHEGSADDWHEMIDTNITGLLNVTRTVLPGMVARRHGHVINIGSIAGHETYARGNVYCATKAAVGVLNKALRLDLIGTGVRVSAVDPGLVPTEFSEVRFHGDRARAATVYENTRPLTAADVAEAIVWCASRPAWVNVEDVLLMPTDQASPTAVHRRPLSEEERITIPLPERWLEAWVGRDAEQLARLYAADGRHVSAGVGTEMVAGGQRALGAHFRAVWRSGREIEWGAINRGLQTATVEFRCGGRAGILAFAGATDRLLGVTRAFYDGPVDPPTL